jgi:hypothetical protein
MPSSATRSGEPLPDRLREPAPAHPEKRETPPEAGFRQSGSTYLPPGRTFWKAGVHRAGFCAQGKLRTLAPDYQVVSMWGHTSRQCNLLNPRKIQGGTSLTRLCLDAGEIPATPMSTDGCAAADDWRLDRAPSS